MSKLNTFNQLVEHSGLSSEVENKMRRAYLDNKDKAVMPKRWLTQFDRQLLTNAWFFEVEDKGDKAEIKI